MPLPKAEVMLGMEKLFYKLQILDEKVRQFAASFHTLRK